MAMTEDIMQRIERLYAAGGERAYSGEPVSQLEHALQSAQAAERDGANDALVCAALLHDVGHLLNDRGDTPTLRGIDDPECEAYRGLLLDAMIVALSGRIHLDAAADTTREQVLHEIWQDHFLLLAATAEPG